MITSTVLTGRPPGVPPEMLLLDDGDVVITTGLDRILGDLGVAGDDKNAYAFNSA